MLPTLIHSLWSVIAAAIVLGLPGLAWAAWLPGHEKSAAGRLADVVGSSLALTALTGLVLHFLRLRLSGAALAGLYLLVALFAVAGWVRKGRVLPRFTVEAGLAGLLAFGLVAWRMLQASSLVLPAWVDSLHHVLIVRTILEQGMIPAALELGESVPFYYHFGFHAAAATFAWMANLSAQQAVLLLGQVINALIALSAYRLAMSLWDSPVRAVVAALLVGLFAQMPAYYLTWGRVTLATGMLLLPLAMARIIDLTHEEDRRQRWLDSAWLGLLTAGLLLSHYLASILLALFLILVAVVLAARDFRRRQIGWAEWLPLAAGAFGGLLAAWFWVARVLQFSGSSFTATLSLAENSPDALYFPGYLNYLYYLLGPQHNYLLLALGLLGAVLALTEGGRGRLFAVWALLLAALALPWGLKLGPLRPDHVAIMLFLPAALLASHLIHRIGAALRIMVPRSRLPGRAALVLVVGLLCVWGIRQTRTMVNPLTVLADQVDLEAAGWVAGNTPRDALFWINTTPWQGKLYRGVDGGWWLEPLAGRRTVLPPVVYAWGSPEYIEQITLWAQASSHLTGCQTELWDVLRETAASYVYLREGKGALQPGALENCAGLQIVYNQGGVWIYKVR